MIQNFTAIDLETTGLNPKTDKIIEVGAVRVRDGKVNARFDSLINPHRKLEERITELTGISEDELQTAPEEEEVLLKFLDFIGEDVLLGHRILFDYSFLKRAVVNGNLEQKYIEVQKKKEKEKEIAERTEPEAGKEHKQEKEEAGKRGKRKEVFERRGIDTLKIARQFLPQLTSRRLSYLCEYYQIPHIAHRAENDAEAAALLYLKMAEEFDEEKAFAPLPLVYKVKRESPITEKQKERLYILTQKHKLVLDVEIDKLTRNEASRLADKIILQYGR